MKKISGNLLLAGMASLLFALAGSTSPAFSKCIQKHPIFGIDVYLEDKYCPKKAIKKTIKKKAVQKKAASVVKRQKAAPVIVAKPDDRIRKMQTLLTSMGYNPGPIDGYDGPETRKAAAEFNISNDLPEKASTGSTIAVLEGLKGDDGIPKTETTMAIATPTTFEATAPTLASAPTPAPVGDSRVRKMQTLLAKMGYSPGPANGINTPATKQAAGEFNVANDLPKKASASSTIAVLSALTGN